MSEPTNSAAHVSWDLSALYASQDDPRIEETLQSCLSRAKAFEQQYKGKIAVDDLTAETLLGAIREIESIAQESAKPGTFASLLFSADTSDTSRQAFMQRMRERGTEISIPTVFFDLELAEIDDAVIERLLADTQLAPYHHYIETERRYRPHLLSQAEEMILQETANTGSRAFSRLFEQTVSLTVFHLDGNELSQSEVLAYLYSADREARRAAAEAFTAGLKTQAPTIAFVFNTLLQDKNVKDRLRKYEYAEQYRHMSNELALETVETVMDACTTRFDVVSRYYNVKREILGVDQLTHYDRYAPLFQSDAGVAWEEARAIVLDAFGEFSPMMRDTAAEFFDKQWIDAAPRKGKHGGAFCSYVTPDTHPFVLQSYLDRGKDVTTLAHELGHGVHSSLSRGQTYFNFHGTLPLAELASTFGEMLVFDKLQKAASLKERLALYADKIEGSFATIFRQAAMYRFEQSLHKHRREEGELTIDQFGEYWQTNIQSMFGDSVKLGEEHRIWWSYIGHFIGSPFYVYAYSVGELLVLSLYQRYKEQGQGFVGNYLDVLRAGGSKSPSDLMAMVGVDMTDPKFWAGGIQVLENEVAVFEQLWKEYNA